MPVMSDDLKITLGGTVYPIAPLTLGQMRKVAPAFTRIGVNTPDGMDAQISVLTAAMQAADSAITMQTVDAIKGVTFDELKEAVEAVGRMMGLGKAEPAPGEAEPAAPAEQASPT